MTLPDTSPEYSIPIPSANDRFWQDKYRAFVMIVDALLSKYVSVNEFQGVWENSTAYSLGQTVVDSEAGGVWRCESGHTSPASPTTFLQYRGDNPTVWTNANLEMRNRGVWASSTEYRVGDIIMTATTNGKVAVCIETHTSASSFASDLALGYWSVLVDLSSYATSAFLGSIATLSPVAASRYVYTTATDTAAAGTISADAISLLAAANYAAMRTAMSVADASHAHAASDITSGTIDTARLGSGTANSSSYLRGDQTWATLSVTQTIEEITGNDTIGNADKGKMFLVTANATIAIDAIADLDSDWWCGIVRIADYNDFGYLVVNPNGVEEVDDQTQVCAYANEEFRIHKRSTVFRTTRQAGPIHFGIANVAGAATYEFFTDGVFWDDPEIVRARFVVKNVSHDNATNRTAAIRLLNGSGAEISGGSDYQIGQITTFAATTIGTEAGGGVLQSIGTGSANLSTDPYMAEMHFESNVAYGTAIHGVNAGSPPNPYWFTVASAVGGLKIYLSGAGTLDAGTAEFWGERKRLS